MAVSVNTAINTPETAVRNAKNDNNQAKTIDIKTKQLQKDCVEIQKDKEIKEKAFAASGAAALLIALSALIVKKSLKNFKHPNTTAIVRVIENNLDFKKAEAVSILNKYLKEGQKVTLQTPKAELKKVYKKLASLYHPDTSPLKGKTNVEDIFKEIGAAYALIK